MTRARALLLAGALLAVSAACGDPPPHVVVIGDSLTAEAHDQIVEAVGDGVDVDGDPGATIEARLGRIREAASRDPDVVVVALGTNDGFFDTPDPGGAANRALDVLRRVECVRWIGVAGVNGEPALVNIPIEQAIAAHPNARLVDWAGPAAQHPEWHQADGVHHTEAGKAAFAAAIADAVDSCRDD